VHTSGYELPHMISNNPFRSIVFPQPGGTSLGGFYLGGPPPNTFFSRAMSQFAARLHFTRMRRALRALRSYRQGTRSL